MVTGVVTPSCQISWKEKRSERRSLEAGSPGTPGKTGRLSIPPDISGQNVFIPLEGSFPSYGHRIKSQVLPNTRQFGVFQRFGRTRLSPFLPLLNSRQKFGERRSRLPT